MNFYPLLFSLLSGFFLVSLFCWLFKCVIFGFVLLLTVFIYMVNGSLSIVSFYRLTHYTPFIFFLLAEALVFLSFIYSCHYFVNENSVSLSDYSGLPFVGCGLLVSSSIMIQKFYEEVLVGDDVFYNNLFFGLFFGGIFILVELCEFSCCCGSFLSNPHDSISYFIVIFHLLHVFSGLICLYWCGLNIPFISFLESCVIKYRLKFIVFYWHFVDVVWLFVYLTVYFF